MDVLSGNEPNELSVTKDDLRSKVDRLSEEVEGVDNGHEDVSLLRLDDGNGRSRDEFSGSGVDSHTRRSSVVGADVEPDRSGHGEEDGREEEGVVVSESLEGGGGGERSGSSRDFVESVDHGVHSSQLALWITTKNVSDDSIELETANAPFPPTISQGMTCEGEGGQVWTAL